MVVSHIFEKQKFNMRLRIFCWLLKWEMNLTRNLKTMTLLLQTGSPTLTASNQCPRQAMQSALYFLFHPTSATFASQWLVHLMDRPVVGDWASMGKGRGVSAPPIVAPPFLIGSCWKWMEAAVAMGGAETPILPPSATSHCLPLGRACNGWARERWS